MSEETVLKEWGMRCPECKRDDHIEINMLVWGVLSPDGTDVTGARDGSHYWDNESDAICTACDFSGTVLDFENAAKGGD